MQAHILLVEDNEGDIYLTKECLETGKVSNSISVVKDGQQAIDYLNKTNILNKLTNCRISNRLIFLNKLTNKPINQLTYLHCNRSLYRGMALVIH